MSPHLQKIKQVIQPLIWRVEAWGTATIVGFLWLLPFDTATAITGWCSVQIGMRSRKVKKKIHRNLAVVHAGESPASLDKFLRQSFYNLGVMLVELVHLNRIWAERDQRIDFVLQPGAERPSRERPCVFIGAHVSAWQLTPMVGPYYDVNMPIIYAAQDNPYVDRLMMRLRRAYGNRLIKREGGIRILMRELDQNHSIGLMLDTRLDTGEPLPFFGEDAWTNTVAARLALRYDCDLVPLMAERLPGGRYQVNILPPIKAHDATASVAEQSRCMVGQVNQLFEQWIRERPGEWFCMKRRWPKATEKRHATITAE